MKVFIVCARLAYGGAERVAAMLASGFAERGHQVTLAANLFDEHSYQVHADVQLRNLLRSNKGGAWKWFRSIFVLRKYLKQERPDVIIGVLPLFSFIAWCASRGLNIPLVATEHNAFERPASAPFTRLQRFEKFVLNRLYKHITVLTEADKSIAQQCLKYVTVMTNPLSLKPAETVPPKKRIVLAAGRMASWHYKGFDLLLRSWNLVRKDYEEWTLEIAGTLRHPDRYSEITTLIKDLNMGGCVRLLDYQQNVERLYRKSEIFVLSSRYEGFGLVLIEAMSQGCACVACDYKGRQRDIITNDEEGLCCPPEDVDALAEAMRRMLSDEPYRKRVQRNAIERSKYYSLENTMNRWEQYLKNEVLKGA